MPSCNTYHLTWVSLGRGVSLHGCSSKAQPLLLTLDEGYLRTAALPDLQCGIAPLGHPAPAQPRLLGRGVGPPGHRPCPRSCGCSFPPPPLVSGLGAWGSSSRHIYIYIYIYTHTHIHTYTHTYTHIHTYTHTHIYIHIYICVCVCMYVYIYIYIYATPSRD